MANFSELKQIRLALDINQAEMGKLLGVNTQSAYQAWEANPDKPAGQAALKRAKDLYKTKTGKEWILYAAPVNIDIDYETPAFLRNQEPLYSPTRELRPAISPASVEQAYLTLVEVLDGVKATPADVDRQIFARILGKAAQEFAWSRNHSEARREVIRDAELFLEILK